MDLDVRIPLDTRSHRPFVREFVELVHSATGKLYSPEIYRRLLDAYAPTRRPSMSTLAAERERAGHALAAASVQPEGPVGEAQAEQRIAPGDLAERIAAILHAKLGRGLDAVAQQQDAQLDFYSHQLQQAEAELRALRDHVGALGVQLAEARQSAEQYRVEAETSRALLAQHVQSIAVLSQNADDMRKFSLMSIEDARAEARGLKEQCAELEMQRQRDAELLDSMRRAHFHAAAQSTMVNSK